jgi:hypothetical protein
MNANWQCLQIRPSPAAGRASAWQCMFRTQTVARGMVEQGRGGATVNVSSMRTCQAIAATPSRGYSAAMILGGMNTWWRGTA